MNKIQTIRSNFFNKTIYDILINGKNKNTSERLLEKYDVILKLKYEFVILRFFVSPENNELLFRIQTKTIKTWGSCSSLKLSYYDFYEEDERLKHPRWEEADEFLKYGYNIFGNEFFIVLNQLVLDNL